MTPSQRRRIQARAERVADKYMADHGGDWGYRLVPSTLLPMRTGLVRIRLSSAANNKTSSNPDRGRKS